MTLPKNITDAIDTLLRRACETLTSAYAMPADEYLRCCTEPARAALEAAILAAIQPAPVEPPTDAEVEAWERKARLELVVGMDDRPIRPRAFHVTETEIEAAVALMRRARAPVDAEVEAWSQCMNMANNAGRTGVIDKLRRDAVDMLRRARANDPLERLRERVQKMTNREFFGDSRLVRLGEVLGWIDEERGASHGG